MGDSIYWGLLIPFAGTTLGSAFVFLLRRQMSLRVNRMFIGFAAGVMVAASVWSLLIPSIDMSQAMGKFSFAPAFIGFWAGVLFLLLLDRIIPHLHAGAEEPEGPRTHLKRTTMLMLAVTLHNIPEGMAVGAMFAGYLEGSPGMTAAGVMALSMGMAIQNVPEGTIISAPLKAAGMGKCKAFVMGTLSGAVEPVFSVITIVLTASILPILPYTLAFAAGAMLYVVVEELIPEMSEGEHSNVGVVSFSAGFSVMMMLDVALG